MVDYTFINITLPFGIASNVFFLPDILFSIMLISYFILLILDIYLSFIFLAFCVCVILI